MVVPLESSAFLLNGPIIKNATSAIITTTSTAMMPINRGVFVFGRSGSTGSRSGGRYGLLRRGAGWRRHCCVAPASGWGAARADGRTVRSRPPVGAESTWAARRLNRGRGGVEGGVGRGGMFGCLRILLRLRGLAITGYRRSAAGAEALVVIQKLAAMGTKPGHDGSFHSMCWLDYKVVQVRLGRRRPNWLCEDGCAAQALSHASQ